MALAEEDLKQIGEYVKRHIGDWMAEQSLGKPPVVDEIELRERMVRHIYSDQPAERFRELLELIAQVNRDETALAILESLLRYYVKGTGRLDEQQARTLLEHRFSGEPLMETFIDRYIAQGEQRGIQLGEAKTLLRLIERKFGPPSEPIRERINQADPDTLLRWFDRAIDARSLDEVLH